MASNLRSKYNEWIIIFVLLPSALAMAVSMFFIWRLLREDHRRVLEDRVVGISAALEQALRSEVLRLRTLASLPATDSLVSIAERRFSSVARSQGKKTEEDWTAAARDDLAVRSVLDNDLGLMLGQLTRQDSHVTSVLVADRHGALLAASEKPSRYYQDAHDWWTLMRDPPDRRPATEGLAGDGRLGLVDAARDRKGALRAVVREEIRFADLALASAIGQEMTNRQKTAVFIVGRQAWPITGSGAVYSNAAGPMVRALHHQEGLAGWTDGYRYRARPLDGGLRWAQPVWVVGVQQEGKLPAAVYGPLCIAFLIGCVVVLGSFGLANKIGGQLFFEPMVEAAEAGLWVLRKVHGRDSQIRGYKRQHPWVNIVMGDDSPVHRELTQWLAALEQTAHGGVEELTAAAQQDLLLATELQQALLRRPYPDLPATHLAGRLRLEFSHSYRPAPTLGGDFFVLEAVGPDCAGLFLGDVMGRGARSALLAAILRGLLLENREHARQPALYLGELNRRLCELLRTLPQPLFTSACYFLADTTARSATFSLAGHPPPFHLHRSIAKVAQLGRPLPQGAALGLTEAGPFGSETIRLVDGDSYVFITDGSYGVVNAEGEPFGLARLERSLRTHIHESPADLLPLVMQDITTFMGHEPASDDICLVAIHVTTQPRPPPQAQPPSPGRI
jgi:serine phosphatase RsbU (regulator of sigma subunit)